MKKIIFIISIIFMSLFGINELKAEETQVSTGTLGIEMFIGTAPSLFTSDISYYAPNKASSTGWKGVGDSISISSSGTTGLYYFGTRELNIYYDSIKVTAGGHYHVEFIFNGGPKLEYTMERTNLGESTSYRCAMENFSNLHACTDFRMNITTVTKTSTYTQYKLDLYFTSMSNSNDLQILLGNTSSSSNYYMLFYNSNMFDNENITLMSAKVYLQDDNSKVLDELNSNQQQTNQKLDIINNQNQTIINQNNQTNNKLDNIDNTMKDDDIDTSGANSFFDDFDSKDHGGLSTIITAPLNALVKITDTCQPITIPILGKNITLPCGDTLFWNKPEVKTFRTIWNILLGGPILYMLLVKLFKVIEGLKNPDDDRIEVAKL